MLSCGSEQKPQVLLEEMSPEETGILFQNDLRFSPDFNIIEYLYFYNGGGVAVGDINNDGREDIYFSANQGPNRLYLNLGDFKFKDITETAGVAGSGNWKTGVNMADVNQDGWLDIISCGVGGYKKFNGRNEVFLNNGDNTFTESAEALGLAFQGFSTHTAFFDADQDGDLDLYLLNHSVHSVRSLGSIDLRMQDDYASGDRLYENRLVPDGRTFFQPMTKKAGLLSSAVGYGLGLAVSDLNRDGLPDLYVSNDFQENDYLYLNQGLGRFSLETQKTTTHTSRFSMGNTSADLNNDGWPELITLDMLPWDEQVIKSSAGEDPFDIFQFKKKAGFHYQFARNTLQLNRGNDKSGKPVFSDIAPFAGMEATDWSWSPLAADLDNDGYKDIYITNGILSRPNDMDYISFISSDSAQRFWSYKEFLKHMPDGRVADVVLRNNRDLTFERQNGSWTDARPGLSNGAAYADLDSDGDLDLVINRINEPALIYRNRTDTGGVIVRLISSPPNRDAYGAQVTAYVDGSLQFQEQQPSRGFQSSVTQALHFSTAGKAKFDSLVIDWPDGTRQVQTTFTSERTLVIKKSETTQRKSVRDPESFQLLREGPLHTENSFSAFSAERLLPHAYDAPGPRIASGDLDRDGWDDLFIGGNADWPSRIIWGGPGRNGAETVLQTPEGKNRDIAACLLTDLDGDGSKDIAAGFGGQEPDSTGLASVIWWNLGRRNFSPFVPFRSADFDAGAIQAADFNGDGKSDLFLGAKLIPGRYGESPMSRILIQTATRSFTPSTESLPENGRLGMIHDAAVTDINQDGKPDLIIAGEWMPIGILINQGNSFSDRSNDFGLRGTNGWWHRLRAGDFDGDGDIDLMAGNHGTNLRLHATAESPLVLAVSDIDRNGSPDPILEYENGGARWPFISRDQLVRQVPSLKKRYLAYSDYANATLSDLLHQVEPVLRLNAFRLTSVFAENRNGRFVLHDLPDAAQLAPIFSILPTDLNGDAYTDFLIAGNLHNVMPEIGRLSASTGTILTGKGNGRFEVMDAIRSGLDLSGECRDLIEMTTSPSGNKRIFVAGMNGQRLKWFNLHKIN